MRCHQTVYVCVLHLLCYRHQYYLPVAIMLLPNRKKVYESYSAALFEV